MKEFKGTPGEWNYSHARGEVVSKSEGLIAELVVNGREDNNGSLIAAAPDLLEALQDALHAYDKHGEHSEWDFARTAINKALGEH
ncbi:hypothetical protein ACOY6S_12720 [Enterobacter bugandensis]|uniref:hypothetical protein n=1 Tax=Enterobacter bugandensis TaxID=881260 RepID=UPI003BC08831